MLQVCATSITATLASREKVTIGEVVKQFTLEPIFPILPRGYSQHDDCDMDDVTMVNAGRCQIVLKLRNTAQREDHRQRLATSLQRIFDCAVHK